MKSNEQMIKNTKISKPRWLCRGMLVLAGFLVMGVAQAMIPASERDGLELLFRSTNGGNWAFNVNWCDGQCPTIGSVTFNRPGTECSWWGVECDPNEEHVIGIRLDGNNLTGSLPELDFILPEVRVFDMGSGRFGRNQFTGAIPPIMGWRHLRVFSVDSAGLSGSIPDLTGLSELGVFSVPFNQLSGPIPSLAGLSALMSFNVESNNLNGAIPTLMGLNNLEGFFVENNQLTGVIPELYGLEHLSWFMVFNNQLSGALPLPSQTLINGYYDGGTYKNIIDIKLCPGNGGLQHQGDFWIYLAWNKASGDIFTPWWLQDGGCN